MLSYKSNPAPAACKVRYDLSKREIKTLRTYAGMNRWPAAYLDHGHPDTTLVDFGLLKIEQIEGDGKFASITESGRAALHNGFVVKNNRDHCAPRKAAEPVEVASRPALLLPNGDRGGAA